MVGRPWTRTWTVDMDRDRVDTDMDSEIHRDGDRHKHWNRHGSSAWTWALELFQNLSLQKQKNAETKILLSYDIPRDLHDDSCMEWSIFNPGGRKVEETTEFADECTYCAKMISLAHFTKKRSLPGILGIFFGHQEWNVDQVVNRLLTARGIPLKSLEYFLGLDLFTFPYTVLIMYCKSSGNRQRSLGVGLFQI